MLNKTLLIVGVSLLSASAFAADTETLNLEMRQYNGSMHEKCIDVKKGEEIAVNFNSQKPIDFNIHWHPDAQSGTQFLVELKDKTRMNESFAMPADQHYCMTFIYRGNEGSLDIFNVDLAYQVK